MKARETFEAVLKNDPRSSDAVRGLYELAKAENRIAEAHLLLNRLIEVDSSLSTVTFAYRERKKLPDESGRSVRIAVLSSYVLAQLIPFLDYECRKAGLVSDFYIAPFNQYTQEILDPQSGLYDFKPEVVFIALALEDLFPEITGGPSQEALDNARQEIRERVLMLTHELTQQSSAIVLLADFVLLDQSPYGILENRTPQGVMQWTEDLNRALADAFRSQERTYLLPLSEVIHWVGKEKSVNLKMRYMASMRLGEGVISELARYCMRYLKPIKGLTRKCIVLDLDGTLWGGVVGELGPDGIYLGPTAPGVEYVDFQKGLLNLTRRGILLAICSKNNPEDVLPVIRSHQYMVLREEHFGAMRINWRNKAENLKEIAQELNIGLDAMVFIDDNPNERELIKQMLPDVLTVELPTDPSRYRLTLDRMSDFELLALTKEDEMRVVQYQAIGKRQAMRNVAASLEEYLYSLTLKATITLANPEMLNRLVQMFNKTNQFNLTTRRYQTAEMNRFLKVDGYRVYALQICDRFADHGIVGAAIIQIEDQYWRIDSLLMSCRVMGLTIEKAFLERIYQDAVRAGVKKLVGEFIPTSKNHPARDFYSETGFHLASESAGHQFWELNLADSIIRRPTWITTTGESCNHDG